MKSLKKMLLGIAICLMGIAVSCGFDTGSLVFAGWGISLFGLIVAAIGYYFTEDDDKNENE